MKSYSKERKEAVLRKMMPPINTPVSQLVKEEGISDVTLYKWRKQLINKGTAVPGKEKNAEKWSAEDKFAVVLETASLNEVEMAEYCRKKGLFVDQILKWKQACINANLTSEAQNRSNKEKSKKDQKEIKSLKSELNRKEKALAETAALLVLRKKADAIWGEDEDE